MYLSKVTLYVEDQEQAKLFWTEKMGFEVVAENPMGPNMTWLEVGSKDEKTSFVLYSKALMETQNPSVSVDTPSLMFSTPDINSKYSEMKEAGIKVDELQVMPYGSMFSFYDQDSNRYLIRED